ncbi:hypothetical protein [Caballeronia sordidicola]|uniref:hypothetical protein n=1 Tax=Caballeronia sordidicola TaxID=196367 RepID=UPI0007649E54|nr:hypothetical protein [Caballeronia sordidicola]
MSTAALVGARRSIQGLDAAYWSARANGVADGYVLLPSQKTRVMALVRAFAARAVAADTQGQAQLALPALLAG